MSLRILFLGLVTCLLLAPPSSAQPAGEDDALRSRDDRIEDLERKLDLLTDELARVRDQVAVPEEKELKAAYGF